MRWPSGSAVALNTSGVPRSTYGPMMPPGDDVATPTHSVPFVLRAAKYTTHRPDARRWNSGAQKSVTAHVGHAGLPGNTAPTCVQLTRFVDRQIGNAFGAETLREAAGGGERAHAHTQRAATRRAWIEGAPRRPRHVGCTAAGAHLVVAK